jgi:hypothetical protein
MSECDVLVLIVSWSVGQIVGTMIGQWSYERWGRKRT